MGLQELCHTIPLSALPSASESGWHSLRGVGPMPPLSTSLPRLRKTCWVASPICAIRPAGNWRAFGWSACVYFLTFAHPPALSYGLVAVMALWITGAYPYAYEARPLRRFVLGFCGVRRWFVGSKCRNGFTAGSSARSFRSVGGSGFQSLWWSHAAFPVGTSGRLVAPSRRRKWTWAGVALLSAAAPCRLPVFPFGCWAAAFSSYGVCPMWSAPRLERVSPAN